MRRHRLRTTKAAPLTNETSLVSPAIADYLRTSAGQEAIARGCLNVLNFEPLRRSLGDRWPARREQIWDHVQQALERRFAVSDLVERISDVEFIVLAGGESGSIAQTACLRGLKELLIHFLGACQPSDLSLQTVLSVDGVTLASETVDVCKVMEATEHDSATQVRILKATVNSSATKAQSLNLLLEGHRLAFELEDVVSIRHDALAGRRIRRLVTTHAGGAPLSRRALSNLDTQSMIKVDLASLDLARDLSEGATADRVRILLLPVSLQTLGHSGARTNYLRALASVPLGQRRLLIEICNLDEGTPNVRVCEAVSLLSGSCRGVVGSTDPTKRALAALAGARLAAVTVQAEDLGPQGDRRPAIQAFADAARMISPIATIRGLLTPNELSAAALAGITYVIPPVRTQVDEAA